MPRSVRHSLAAVLVGLHVAVTLCGPGLHALPGLGHQSGLNLPARTDHSHGPGKSSHESADECPVCHFLAQGQVELGPARAVVAWLTLGVAPLVSAAPTSATPHSPSSPRAPPHLHRNPA